jgi:hypothetical protein
MLTRAKIPLLVVLTSLFLACSVSSGIAQYTVTVTVQATAGDAPPPSTWTDSGIVLVPGQTANIWASGSASWNGGKGWTGPEGTTAGECGARPCRDPSDPLPGASIGSLIGKIGDGPAFYVGTGPVTVAGTGRLIFAYQDGYGDHSDNQGYYTVTITVSPPPVTVVTQTQPVVTVVTQTQPVVTVVTQTQPPQPVTIITPSSDTGLYLFAAAVILAAGLIVFGLIWTRRK